MVGEREMIKEATACFSVWDWQGAGNYRV